MKNGLTVDKRRIRVDRCGNPANSNQKEKVLRKNKKANLRRVDSVSLSYF